MTRFLHFTDNAATFKPTNNTDAPQISLECGGLFVYHFPDSSEDFNVMWKSWGYRDAIEIFVDDEEKVVFNADSPSDEDDIFAEYIIPFSEFEKIRYYRVDC